MKKDATKQEINAYAAGLFDGEGTISIHKEVFRSGNTGYRLRVRMANTDRDVLEWMRTHFNGSVNQHKQVKCHKPYWEWVIGSAEAERFIRKIYPYLHIKLNHARVALTFRSCEWELGGETFWEQMKALNK